MTPDRIGLLWATWFGCGYFPKGPGTAGSIGALLVAWPLVCFANWPPIAFVALALALLLPSIWASDVAIRVSGNKDPQFVVVDEVLGQWITLGGALTHSWRSWLLALLLFRLFDIWKPPPVRQLERLRGGVGVMADDCMAGVYGFIVLYAAARAGIV